MEKKACTFFGHRDSPASIRPQLRALLMELVERQGVTTFYVGNHGAFDAMAAGVLRELKLLYPEISFSSSGSRRVLTPRMSALPKCRSVSAAAQA